ncbi:Fc.00g094370.m01.CDS01 [Cosmosporella sp. VM-42]
MTLPEERSACKPCARTKRKCGKEKPSCQRCRKKEINCSYPPPKPSCFIRLREPTPTARSIEDESSPSGWGIVDLLVAFGSLLEPRDELFASELAMPTALDLTFLSQESSRCPSDWFLAPETWEIDHRPIPLPSTFSSNILKRHIKRTQDWLKTWAKTGSCPFVHRELYRARFPGYLQTAYTTLSSYIHKTEGNADIILQIVMDQARQLLLNNGVPTNNPNVDCNMATLEPIDPLCHIARVHALLVYVTTCLFDGDVQARHLAEGYMEILNTWAEQMIECAGRSLPPQSSLFDPIANMQIQDVTLNEPTTRTRNSWHCWILTESIRRTWSMAKALHSVYYMLQKGWILCPGRMFLTVYEGVWVATKAVAWEKRCTEIDKEFFKGFETRSFLEKSKPSDVDEFGKMMLEIRWGMEMLEKWGL